MTIYDVEIFLLVFFMSYLALAVGVKLIHLITKDHSKTYRIGVIVFSLLVAAAVTYSQLGRVTGNYPAISQPSASPLTNSN